MFFRQIMTTSGNFLRAAGHNVPSGDDPDVEIESYDYEPSTAYPANTVVWYSGSAYISVTMYLIQREHLTQNHHYGHGLLIYRR